MYELLKLAIRYEKISKLIESDYYINDLEAKNLLNRWVLQNIAEKLNISTNEAAYFCIESGLFERINNTFFSLKEDINKVISKE
jgi:hypothetical protein